jgi:hypothetical protein
MYTAIHLSPMIPSFDMEKTARFFRDLFHFSVVRTEKNYIILSKDGLSIHILNAGKDIGEMEFYLEVEGLDDLWLEMKDKLGGIKIKAPFDRDYGMREFHIIVPHTKTLLFVGQFIKS